MLKVMLVISSFALYSGGYGVGVARSMISAYRRSIADRISRGVIPSLSISITARVTFRQTSQVGAIESKMTDPSAFTVSM